jgi:hypothetical protein
MVDPPPGYQPAYYIRNMDVPQFLTWMELSKTNWLLPNEHAPWQWAAETTAQLAASRTLLQKLFSVTEQAWQQAVDEAKRSLPQGQQSSLPALAELLRKLSEQ